MSEFDMSKFFMDEEDAMSLFRHIHWSNGVFCPNCKSYNVIKRGHRGKVDRFTCKECGVNFSDFTDTIFEKSRLPLGMVFWILSNIHNKSVLQMSKELKVSRKAIARITNLIRSELLKNDENSLLDGEIEIDEVYIVAGDKGVKKNIQEKED